MINIIATVEVEEWFAMYSMYKYGHIKHEQLCLTRSSNKLIHTFNKNNIKTVEAGITEVKAFHLQLHSLTFVDCCSSDDCDVSLHSSITAL